MNNISTNLIPGHLYVTKLRVHIFDKQLARWTDLPEKEILLFMGEGDPNLHYQQLTFLFNTHIIRYYQYHREAYACPLTLLFNKLS